MLLYLELLYLEKPHPTALDKIKASENMATRQSFPDQPACFC